MSSHIDHLATGLIAEFADGTISVKKPSSIYMSLTLKYSRLPTITQGRGNSNSNTPTLSQLNLNKSDVIKSWYIDFGSELNDNGESIIELRGSELHGKMIEISSNHIEILELIIPLNILSNTAMKAPLHLESALITLHFIIPPPPTSSCSQNPIEPNINNCLNHLGDIWERSLEIPIKKPDAHSIYKALLIAKEKKLSFEKSISLKDEVKVLS